MVIPFIFDYPLETLIAVVYGDVHQIFLLALPSSVRLRIRPPTKIWPAGRVELLTLPQDERLALVTPIKI